MAPEATGQSQADAQPPIASTSTGGPSATKYGSTTGAAPGPPSIAAHKDQGHSRRPSRAERYEGVIATARETLRRATGGSDEAELEVGPASDPLLAERRRRSKRLSSASFEPLPERDWRETVRSLLNVVEGMVRISRGLVLAEGSCQADHVSHEHSHNSLPRMTNLRPS